MSDSIEALESQAFGLMGRLHVLLRREIGRVTDVKYMSTNPEYCRHVLEIAADVNNPDLQLLSQKLQQLYFGERGLFADISIKPKKLVSIPLPIKKPLPVKNNLPPSFNVTPESITDTDEHYIGRLR
jgi:hypothetical protein